MKLSAPKKVVFWIAVVLAVIAILMAIGLIGFIPVPAVWVAVAAFVLLFLGNVLKGF